MLLTILIYSGSIALILLILYLVARLSPPVVGDSISFPFIFVARPLVKLQGILEKAAKYCNEVFEKSLKYPPNVGNDVWHGVNVIARNILFLVSGIVIDGDLYNTLQSVPLLFGGAGAVSLPGSFAIPQALLFVCMSALYAEVALEAAGVIPYGSHLFPTMTGKVRKWLGVLCGIGFVLSLLFAVLFWVFRGVYIFVDPDSAGVLAIPLFALVGVILTGSFALSLWGLVVGLTGVITLVFWLLSFVFHAAAGGVSIVPSQLDVFVQHITQGRISVYGELLGHDPYKVPNSPFPASHRSITSHATTAVLPEHADSVDTDAVLVVPVLTPGLEEKLSNPDKNASLVFVGSFGTKMFTPTALKIASLHATETILTCLYLDLSITHVSTAIPDIVDLSPTFAQRKAALLHSETEGQAYQTLLNRLEDRLVETHLDTKASPAPLIFIIDCHVLVDCVEMLESIKRRLPLHALVVVTSVSSLDVQNKTVQTGLSDMQALVAEDIIETVIVTDLHSAVARQYGEETQHHFLAHTLISLVIAHKHNLHNRSFTNVLRDLHCLSPFTAVSIASEPVAVGDVPKKWAWVPGTKGQAGTGNYGDIIAQTRSAITRVVTDKDTCTFSASVRSDVPCIVLSSIPLALSDTRHADCVRDTALFVGSHFPLATSIAVRGNGCRYPHDMGSRFRVQASCLYPLQPQSFPKVQNGKQLKVTPLYPVTTTIEPTSSNGHMPTNEQAGETKKGTPSARQKKATTSSKRVVRKNTKLAQ